MIDPRWYVLPILLLAFGLRVYRLDVQSFWGDEIFAGALTMLPLDRILENLLAVRNHVPLYYVLLRLWSLIGSDEFTLRFLSVIWGMVSIALMYRVGVLIGGRAVGCGAVLLLALSPFHAWYSQEARMYTMLPALTLLQTWFLIRLLRRDRWTDWLGYGLAILAAAYTHILAAFVVVAHYVFFSLHYRLVRRAFLKWFAWTAVSMVPFGIWMGILLFGGGFTRSPIGWIAPARWYEPVLTLLAFSAGTTIDPGRVTGYLSLAVCLGAVVLCAIRPTQVQIARFLASRAPAASSDGATSPGQTEANAILNVRLMLCWLFVPLAFTWLISLDLPIPQKRSIYMDRYLTIVLPALLLLVACGLRWAVKRWKGAIAAWVVVLVVAVLSFIPMYGTPAYARDDWRAAVAFIEAALQDDEMLVLRPSHALPVVYYTTGPLPYQEFPSLFYAHERDAFLAQEIEPRVQDIARRSPRLWLISAIENTNPHGFPQARNAALADIAAHDPVKAWLDAHYPVLEERRWPGIVLSLYDLAPSHR